jgi:hypothetical protein
MIKRGLALFALLFIFVVYFIYPLSTIAMGRNVEQRFSPYADSYDDLSDFKEDIEGLRIYNDDDEVVGEFEVYSIVASPTILNGPDVEPEDSIYIGVGMERKYTDDEVNALLEYLRKGGHAILADDYGYLSEFARYFRVTYYRGKFFDNEFDRNENFTIVNAKISVDKFTPYIPTRDLELELNQTNTFMLNNLDTQPPTNKNGDLLNLDWFDVDPMIPDGIWDSDQDGDGRIDEDPPEKGTPIDDDMDKAKSVKDGLDNDHDSTIDDEDPNEGLNEDHMDDDGDWIDINMNGVQEPMIWRDKNNDGEFSWIDADGDNLYDLSESILLNVETSTIINEYISGDYGVDEERFDGKDNDGDSLIDEDLEGYTILFNDATGMTSQGTRIIAHGGTSDPPSYVNLDNKPGAHTPSISDDFSAEKVVDEISSPGSEIQLIVEVVICPSCGGAVDVRTGECLDTTAEFTVKSPCNEKYETKEFTKFGSVIFISDSSLFVNDIYELDHLATDDDTEEVYRLDEFGIPVNNIPITEWDDSPQSDGISDEDKQEAMHPEETNRDFYVDRTPDGEFDYDNKKFGRHLIKYLLGEGGQVYFDESRHFIENEYLIPVYASLQTITFLTSDPWYSSAMIIIFILLLSFVITVVRNKENWIHKHDINLLHGRKSLPEDRTNQLERVRWAILNKARMSRGLSPEEFKELGTTAVNDIIKDPQLIDIVRNQGRTYTEQELKIILDKATKFGK